jgi:hypothetical protein
MNERKFSQQLYNQYMKQGGCCYYCKKEFPYGEITRDHFLPISEGNTLINNKVFACRKCNSLKGDKSIDEFKDFLLLKLTDILKAVVDNNWMMTQKQLDKFTWYSKMLKTVGEIIDNDYKPLIIFT